MHGVGAGVFLRLYPYSVVRGAGRGEKSGAMSDRWVPTRATGPWTPTIAPGALPCPEWVSFTCFCIRDTVNPAKQGLGDRLGALGPPWKAGVTDAAAGQTRSRKAPETPRPVAVGVVR